MLEGSRTRAIIGKSFSCEDDEAESAENFDLHYREGVLSSESRRTSLTRPCLHVLCLLARDCTRRLKNFDHTLVRLRGLFFRLYMRLSCLVKL